LVIFFIILSLTFWATLYSLSNSLTHNSATIFKVLSVSLFLVYSCLLKNRKGFVYIKWRDVTPNLTGCMCVCLLLIMELTIAD